MKYGLMAIAGTFFLSCSFVFAMSVELQEAEANFERRSNKSDLLKAKKLYEKIITKSDNKKEKIHAFDKYARLAVLEGQLGQFVWGKSAKNSAHIFERCISLSRNINYDNLGMHVLEYYYWRAACIGLWAKNTNIFHIGMKSGLIIEMIDLINYGESNFPDFEHGGFLLLRAGLNTHSSALKLINQYNPEQALRLIQKIRKYEPDDYTVYLIEAEAYAALQKKREARAALRTGIQELEKRIVDDNISSLYIFESKALLSLLKESERKFK